MQYTIKSHKNNVTEIEIVFEDGTKYKDKMQNLPVDSKEAMDEFVKSFSEAYLAGLALETKLASDLKLNTKNIIE